MKILFKGQEIPARTGLGATSALAVVTIGFGGKTKPQVAYATALDVFIIICSVLVFFALAEFALLSFLDVYIKRYKEKEELRAKQDKVGPEYPHQRHLFFHFSTLGKAAPEDSLHDASVPVSEYIHEPGEPH